jgi:hypothetical protein
VCLVLWRRSESGVKEEEETALRKMGEGESIACSFIISFSLLSFDSLSTSTTKKKKKAKRDAFLFLLSLYLSLSFRTRHARPLHGRAPGRR